MTQLVEDLLTLSRLEVQDALDEDVVAMAPMLATPQARGRGAEPGPPRGRGRIRADADLRGSTRELHSAFSNLVSNAVRYTPWAAHR